MKNDSFWVDSKQIPHLHFAWAMKHYAASSTASLRWVIADCQQSIVANPDNRKNGLYADTISVCGMILSDRKEA